MQRSKKNFISTNLLATVNLLLLNVIFLTLQANYQLVAAYSTRKEAAAEYKNCESKKEIIEKIYCMSSLRRRLGDYGDSSYSGSLWDKSQRELRAIYRKERKRAQVKIARLPVNN